MGQVMDKLMKREPTPVEVHKLAIDIQPIIDEVYKADLEGKQGVEYDDLYHAIFKIIQELRKKSGAMQYELPTKETLIEAFKEHHKSTGSLTKKECIDIISSAIKLESFYIGQGAIDILLYLFGVPICALLAKRIIPGMRSISDDVVIPIATSGSVVFLSKTNKL